MYDRRPLLQEVLFIPQEYNYSVNSGHYLSLIELFVIRVRVAAVGICCRRIGSRVCAVEVV